METLLFDCRSDLVLLVHAAVEPSDEDWTVYVTTVQDSARRHGEIRILVLTPGTGPNSTQRKKIQEFQGDARSAVVTGSRLARGIVTAIGWLGTNIVASSPKNIQSAFSFLDIPAAEQEDILRRLLEMWLQLNARSKDELTGMDGVQLQQLLEMSVQD